MKIKLLTLGVITSLFISCSSGPTACECLDIYEYKGVNVATFSEDIKGKDPRPCIEKFGKDIPDQYRGTNEFVERMKSTLRKECNK
jgi:hypothetical protein